MVAAWGRACRSLPAGQAPAAGPEPHPGTRAGRAELGWVLETRGEGSASPSGRRARAGRKPACASNLFLFSRVTPPPWSPPPGWGRGRLRSTRGATPRPKPSVSPRPACVSLRGPWRSPGEALAIPQKYIPRKAPPPQIGGGGHFGGPGVLSPPRPRLFLLGPSPLVKGHRADSNLENNSPDVGTLPVLQNLDKTT